MKISTWIGVGLLACASALGGDESRNTIFAKDLRHLNDLPPVPETVTPACAGRLIVRRARNHLFARELRGYRSLQWLVFHQNAHQRTSFDTKRFEHVNEDDHVNRDLVGPESFDLDKSREHHEVPIVARFDYLQSLLAFTTNFPYITDADQVSRSLILTERAYQILIAIYETPWPGSKVSNKRAVRGPIRPRRSLNLEFPSVFWRRGLLLHHIDHPMGEDSIDVTAYLDTFIKIQERIDFHPEVLYAYERAQRIDGESSYDIRELESKLEFRSFRIDDILEDDSAILLPPGNNIVTRYPPTGAMAQSYNIRNPFYGAYSVPVSGRTAIKALTVTTDTWENDPRYFTRP